MKSTKYLNHAALKAIRIDLSEGTLFEQIESIRRSYKFQTGHRLKFRHAVEWLDLLMAGFRAQVADQPKTGFGLVCPDCYAGEEDLVICPNDLSTVECMSCYGRYTPQEARDIIAAQLVPWDKFIATIAPLPKGDAAEKLPAHRQEERELVAGCLCRVAVT